MSAVPNLLAFVGPLEPIQVRHRLGPAGDGDGDSFGEAVVVSGRWEESARQIQNAEGQVVLVVGAIYVSAAGSPRPGDEVARGDGTTGQEWRRVELVDTAEWFGGAVMHYEVYVS